MPSIGNKKTAGFPRFKNADKAHKRKNRPTKIKIGCNSRFFGLQTFSTLCQSVDFVNT